MKMECKCMCTSASKVVSDGGNESHIEYVLQPYKADGGEIWGSGDLRISSTNPGTFVVGQEYKLAVSVE